MANNKKKSKQKTIQSMASKKLTANQQKFVDAYDGNIKKTAKKIGLSHGYCRTLMTKNYILKKIQSRQETEIRPKTIADRQERQIFWTGVQRNKKAEMKDRLRASELLGKSEADFTENINNKFPEGVPELKIVVEK